MLSCYGFSVHDLGGNVPAGVFLAQAQAIRPQIIGLSGLTTASHDAMQNTVRLLRQAGDPMMAALPIIISGSQISQQVCG